MAIQGGALLTHSLKWPCSYFIDGKTEPQEVSHLPQRSQPWYCNWAGPQAAQGSLYSWKLLLSYLAHRSSKVRRAEETPNQ